jgi:hypothetical protein
VEGGKIGRPIILQAEGFRATDRVTLDRDLKQLHAKWAECNPEDFEKLRQVQLKAWKSFC